MSKVSRFFHIRPREITRDGTIRLGTRGGATVRVNGDLDGNNPVEVQVAFCSPLDTFSKKVGRLLASQAPAKLVPLRYLPAELARITEASTKKTKSLRYQPDYAFATKYFLPKE